MFLNIECKNFINTDWISFSKIFDQLLLMCYIYLRRKVKGSELRIYSRTSIRVLQGLVTMTFAEDERLHLLPHSSGLKSRIKTLSKRNTKPSQQMEKPGVKGVNNLPHRHETLKILELQNHSSLSTCDRCHSTAQSRHQFSSEKPRCDGL